MPLWKPWSSKPPPNTPVDWSNPLCRSLVSAFSLSEGKGNPVDSGVCAGLTLVPFDASAGWGSYLNGNALKINTTVGSAFKTNAPPALQIQPPITIVWSGMFPAKPGSGFNPGLWGLCLLARCRAIFWVSSCFSKCRRRF